MHGRIKTKSLLRSVSARIQTVAETYCFRLGVSQPELMVRLGRVFSFEARNTKGKLRESFARHIQIIFERRSLKAGVLLGLLLQWSHELHGYSSF